MLWVYAAPLAISLTLPVIVLSIVPATAAAAFCTLSRLLYIPFASPVIKSGIHFSYSRKGPSSGLEKCKTDDITPATLDAALCTAPIMELIPSIIPPTKSLPHWTARPGRLVIKFIAPWNPFWTTEVKFDKALRIPLTRFLNPVVAFCLMLFTALLIVVFMLFQIFVTVVFAALSALWMAFFAELKALLTAFKIAVPAFFIIFTIVLKILSINDFIILRTDCAIFFIDCQNPSQSPLIADVIASIMFWIIFRVFDIKSLTYCNAFVTTFMISSPHRFQIAETSCVNEEIIPWTAVITFWIMVCICVHIVWTAVLNPSFVFHKFCIAGVSVAIAATTKAITPIIASIGAFNAVKAATTVIITGATAVKATTKVPITTIICCTDSGKVINQLYTACRAFVAIVSAWVTIGIITDARFAIAASNCACASLFAISAALLSRYPCATPARPWEDNTSIIIWARSDSEDVVASFSLNASSLIPAQFKASAKVPVTTPTCAVSLIASARLSIGMESPYCAQAPMASSVICVKSL